MAAAERSTINAGLAAMGAAPAFANAGATVTAAGTAAQAAAAKVTTAQQAYDAAKLAADAANQKVTASAAALREAAAAGGQNAAAIQSARAAYDAARAAADAANAKLNASKQAFDAAKASAAQLNSTLGATNGNLNSVAGSANAAANSFVSMGRQYLTTRNSIQSNPITSIHTIRTIVEGGGANVAPGPSATKYYPRFAEGGIYENPAGSGFAILHSGERVLTPEQTKAYDSGTGIADAVAAGVSKALSALGFGLTVHGDVKLSNDYPFERFAQDVTGNFRAAREARGYRTG